MVLPPTIGARLGDIIRIKAGHGIRIEDINKAARQPYYRSRLFLVDKPDRNEVWLHDGHGIMYGRVLNEDVATIRAALAELGVGMEPRPEAVIQCSVTAITSGWWSGIFSVIPTHYCTERLARKFSEALANDGDAALKEPKSRAVLKLAAVKIDTNAAYTWDDHVRNLAARAKFFLKYEPKERCIYLTTGVKYIEHGQPTCGSVFSWRYQGLADYFEELERDHGEPMVLTCIAEPAPEQQAKLYEVTVQLREPITARAANALVANVTPLTETEVKKLMMLQSAKVFDSRANDLEDHWWEH